MVRIGTHPILWHLMQYYAHFGHRDFVLCLGYRAEMIRNYFLSRRDFARNEELTNGGQTLKFLDRDGADWSITFVDTGLSENIGQRLKAVQRFVDGDRVFLANYSDALTNFPLPKLIADLLSSDAVASFLSVPPRQSFHVVRSNEDNRVSEITEIAESGVLINGGFFVLRREIFDYLHEGEDLVSEPFGRLILRGKLTTLNYRGFWGCMDTFKDQQRLEELYLRGEAPWTVWRRESGSAVLSALGQQPTPRTDIVTLPGS